MKLLNRYILESFVITFSVTLVVVTLIMCLGAMFQITDMLAKGVPLKPIAIIFFSGIPVVLAFSIPISAVTSSLLVFERISAEGELAAMKACGISIWQIISRPVMFAVFLSCVCLYINTELVARMHYVQRKTIFLHKHDLAASVWESGEFVRDIPGMAVYVGSSSLDKQTGKHAIKDVIIYDNRAGGTEREIRAGSGFIETSADGSQLTLFLKDNVRVDPLVPGKLGFGLMDSYKLTIDISRLSMEYRKRMADQTAGELIDGIISSRQDTSSKTGRVMGMLLAVELNQRIVLSLSCIGFVLLGIPFGITSRRSSSSGGIATSLLMVFSFYLFILLADSLAKRPETRPDLIIWTPAVISIVAGLYLLKRMR